MNPLRKRFSFEANYDMATSTLTRPMRRGSARILRKA